MGKLTAKPVAAAQASEATFARPSAPSRMPGARSLRPRQSRAGRYGFLIAATFVLAAGVFLAWQTALVLIERNQMVELDGVRATEIRTLGQLLAATRERVQNAFAVDAVTNPLAQSWEQGREGATAAIKQTLPDLIGVDFYRNDIGDVLAADLAKLGYGRSALLVQASRTQAITPAQSLLVAGQRILGYALPMRREHQLVAFAFVTLPFEPVLAAFRQPALAAGRMDLRQGNGSGDLIIASVGDGAGNSLGDSGEAIADSAFRLGIVPPQPLILMARDLTLLIPSMLLVLFLGATLFYARLVGWRVAFERMVRRKPSISEPTLAQMPISGQTPPPIPAPQIKPMPVNSASPVAAPEPAVERSMFRAYDIRGVLGKTLNAGVARLIGRAIGSEMTSRNLKTIAVGRDGRLSGPELSAALIEGLRSAGADVTDIGAAPTPVTYFAAQHLDLGSCVSVTGSHNPPDYNGFKIVLGGETLAEQAIQNLYTRIAERDLSSGAGTLVKRDVSADYRDRICNDVQLQRPLKVVVDCGNGIAGAIAPQVLQAIGAEVVPLYCEVDGNFPNHHPDPSDLHNLRDLILSVEHTQADLGLAFDGDGDRLGVVTRSGEVIFPDRLLMLFARDVLARNPGATIIYDVKCTGKLQDDVLQAGGSPLMWRTGHSLIKSKMRETQAALAGEMSGHFFFKERWYGFDDGIYAAARLLEILAADPAQRSAQAQIDELPNSVSTPELKIELAEGEHYRFIERFKAEAKFPGARLITIDGVRADWPDGWGLVRASNTTPVLVLRFDADNTVALDRVQNVFRSQILAIEPNLKLPF